MNTQNLSGTTLAYIGDAVLELIIRQRLVERGMTASSRLNEAARGYVSAKAQSRAVENILPILTEDEEALFKRGRNASGISVPKSASAIEYRRATGFEALFGALYLNGQSERIEQLFSAAFPEKED